MTELDKLAIITDEEDMELLVVLYGQAERKVLAYTNRKTMIPELRPIVLDMATIFYNRLGTEGESGRSEAGENYSFFDFPDATKLYLNRYRLARVGGKTYEADEA